MKELKEKGRVNSKLSKIRHRYWKEGRRQQEKILLVKIEIFQKRKGFGSGILSRTVFIFI